MLIRDEARVMIESIWGEKMKWALKLNSSVRGLLSRGFRDDIFNIKYGRN